MQCAKNILFRTPGFANGIDPIFRRVHGKVGGVGDGWRGGFAMMPLEQDGSLKQASSVVRYAGKGPHPRQEAPHAHMITPGPDGKYIYGVDLGVDKVISYEIDADNNLLRPTGSTANIKPGAGPRHLTFHPTQDWAYVVNELVGTIDAFKVDPPTGTFKHFQNITTLPENTTEGGACADIHIHPSGKYLYASNRGSVNTIAMYAIDQASGKLKLLGQQPTLGETPRNFVIDPSGTFLLVANQDSGNVVSFRIDENTGLLTETANTKIPTPVCLKFL